MLRIMRNGETAPVYEFPEGTEIVPRENSIEVVGKFIIGDLNQNNALVTGNDAAYLSHIKEQKTQEIRDQAEARLAGGFEFNGVPVDTSEKGLSRLNMAKSKSRASRKIVTAGGKGRLLATSTQYDAIYAAIENHGQAIMNNWYDLLAALDEATTSAEVEAIDANSGWPA